MKINRKEKLFYDVEVGEVFSVGEVIAMKIGPIYSIENTPINAIDLSDGCPLCYEATEAVTTPNAELIV